MATFSRPLLSMIKLCILDFDGTLCATHEAIRLCIGLTFDHYGVVRPAPANVEKVIEAGVVMAEAMRQLNSEQLSVEASHRWAATYRAFYLERGLAHSTLFPGVAKALEGLETLGVRMIIASNKSEASVRMAIDHFGIARYIGLLVCDPANMPKKPDPACYERIIAPAYPDVERAEIVVVGDTHADIGFARNIGGLACWAEYGFGNKTQCAAMNPEMTLKSMGGLVEWVKRQA